MAYTITSESYGRRLPKITATADSTDDLATLSIDWAEGSSCVIGTKTYVLDKVSGWVESGSGSGSSDYFDVVFTYSYDEGEARDVVVSDKTFEEVAAAINAGKSLRAKLADSGWPSYGVISDLYASVYFIDGNVDSMRFLSTPEVQSDGVIQTGINWSFHNGFELVEVEYPSSEPKPDPT